MPDQLLASSAISATSGLESFNRFLRLAIAMGNPMRPSRSAVSPSKATGPALPADVGFVALAFDEWSDLRFARHQLIARFDGEAR